MEEEMLRQKKRQEIYDTIESKVENLMTQLDFDQDGKVS